MSGADPERSVLVGVDIGTSAVKVLATLPGGETVASASQTYPLSTPRPGYVEQDANLVYRATMKALTDVLAEVRQRGDREIAIGFSCAMHGVLFVDEHGEPLGPLVTWMDRRSAEIADAWRHDGTAAKLYALTGAPVHPMLPSCKLRWFAEHEPATIERAHKAVSIKELIVFRWTGEWLVDYGMAAATGLFDLRDYAWNGEALAAARVDPALLSEPVKTTTTLRALRPVVARALGIDASTPIVLASSDGALANLGVGAVSSDDLALTLGTSGAVRTVVDRPTLDPHGRTFCYAFDDTRYLVGGPTSSAGAVLAALQGLFMPEVPWDERSHRALELARESLPGANGLTVLPFLSGERAPYWLAELRGGMVGLDLSHTRADVMRAAFESVVFALASVYDVLRPTVGDVARIRLSGGLTHAPLVRELVANVFATEAVLTDQSESSAYGAAMMAGIAIGEFADADAVAKTLSIEERERPDDALAREYAPIFARYRAVVAANVPLFTAP